MRIAIDASRANIERKTGVAWYAFNLLKTIPTIARLSEEDRVIYYTQESLDSVFADLPSGFEQKILKWPPRLWTHLRLGLQVSIDRPDVFFVPAHVLPFQAPRYRATKVITTLHDVAFARFPETYSKQERRYQDWAVRCALTSCEYILVPSEWTRQELIALYGADPHQIVVTPLAYDADRYHLRYTPEQQQETLNRYGITRPFFFSIGRLEHKKNTANTIRAFNDLRKQIQVPLSLIIAGEPGYGYEEIEPLLTTDGVHSLGWVATEDLPILLSCAAAFIFPTRYEGFGIPILEAMACGVPVITSNYGATKEVARDAAILVNPDNRSDVTIAMLRLLTDPALAQDLVERGFRRIQQFSWRACASKTWDVLYYRGHDAKI